MKYWKIGLAGALIVLPIAAIAAGPGNGPDGGLGWGHHGGGDRMGSGHGGFPGPRMIEMLQGMDADRDGVISAEEFATGHEDHMTAADGDGDGSITLEEMEAFAMERVREHVAERFARLDADGDGAITAEEFASRSEDRFADMDRDGDGNLTIHDLGRGDHDGPDGEMPMPPVEEAPAE